MRIVTTGGGLRTRPKLRAMVALTLGLAIGWIAVLPLSYFRTYLGRAADAPPPLVQIPRSDSAAARPQISADTRRDPANATGPASTANKAHGRRLTQNTTQPKPIKTSLIAPSLSAPPLTVPSLNAPPGLDVTADTARRSDPAARALLPFPEFETRDARRLDGARGQRQHRDPRRPRAQLQGRARRHRARRRAARVDRALGRPLDRRDRIGPDLHAVSGWWASIGRALPLSHGSSSARKWMPLCLHAIAAGALALRLAMVWRSEHLGHPDEVFQYLEQAHRLVYGYGFVPWEYRFARRNWLLPGALAGLLEALRLAGFDRPDAYIPALKALFAILSVSLVYAANALGRSLFGVRAGLIAAALAAFWYELVEASTRATPEVLATYALVVALALATGPSRARRAAAAGLLLGIVVALRLQYAPCAAAVWMVCAIGWGWRPALVAAAAAAVMPALAGVLDLVAWGAPFASYYNSIVLDVVYRVSEMFGTAPWFYYAGGLWIASGGVFAAAAAYGVVTWRKSWPILLVLVALLVPHALIAHKEYRFTFLAVPLLLVLAAAAIAAAGEWLRMRRVAPGARALATAAAFAIIAAVSVAGFRNYGVFRQDDRLLAALDLARRSDVAAVLDLATPWYLSGGFYYLHHDVPVLLQAAARRAGRHRAAPARKPRAGRRIRAGYPGLPAALGPRRRAHPRAGVAAGGLSRARQGRAGADAGWGG